VGNNNNNNNNNNKDKDKDIDNNNNNKDIVWEIIIDVGTLKGLQGNTMDRLIRMYVCCFR
jgi:hypothetical protein